MFSPNASKIVHNSSPPSPHLYPPLLLICRLLPCLTWNSDTMNRGAWAKLYFLKIAAMRGQDPYFPPKYPFPIPATSMGGIQPISGEFWQNNMKVFLMRNSAAPAQFPRLKWVSRLCCNQNNHIRGTARQWTLINLGTYNTLARTCRVGQVFTVHMKLKYHCMHIAHISMGTSW